MNKKDFPTLDECRKRIKNSFTDKKLTDDDEHIIGTLWAFIEGKLGLTPENLE